MNQAIRVWRWPLIAAAAGFATSALFSDGLQWERAPFVAAHSIVVIGLLAAYVHTEGVDLVAQFRRRSIAGALGGIILGLLLIREVQAQPSSARPDGLALVGALAGYGVWYAIVDAMLLTVLPVLTVYGAQSRASLTSQAGRLRYGGLALLASGVVATAYHLGFAEFRAPQLLDPIMANTLITLAYLLTGSPVAAIVAHVLMHVAAVIHALATAAQLPPHI